MQLEKQALEPYRTMGEKKGNKSTTANYVLYATFNINKRKVTISHAIIFHLVGFSFALILLHMFSPRIV